MNTASKDYFRGLGYLVYAIAHSDGEVDPIEAKNFANTILQAFGEWVASTKGLAAIATYEMALDNELETEEAYQKAIRHFSDCIDDIKAYRVELLGILESVAESDTVYSRTEVDFIERFRKDIDGF